MTWFLVKSSLPYLGCTNRFLSSGNVCKGGVINFPGSRYKCRCAFCPDLWEWRWCWYLNALPGSRWHYSLGQLSYYSYGVHRLPSFLALWGGSCWTRSHFWGFEILTWSFHFQILLSPGGPRPEAYLYFCTILMSKYPLFHLYCSRKYLGRSFEISVVMVLGHGGHWKVGYFHFNGTATLSFLIAPWQNQCYLQISRSTIYFGPKRLILKNEF